jgi:CrcB protein
VSWTGVAIWSSVALAGGFGAVCRVLVDHLVVSRAGARWPWGTGVVNVTGSFGAGVIGGWVTSGLPVEVGVVVAGGFLGAYTTFSTAMVEVVRQVEAGKRGRALGALLAPLVLATAAAWLGWWLVA